MIKLNGGLGTSMGMDRAKSLLCVRRGLSFLDIIARQVLHLRKEYDATAAADLHEQLPHLRRHDGRAGPLRGPRRSRGCRWSSCRTRSPSSWPRTSRPVSYPKDPDLEWCPPGHGDLYTALRGTGLLDRLIDAGYERRLRLQLRQPRRRARTPGSPAGSPTSGAPFAIEAVRRTPSDRKGGHFARRKSDGRIVLRETAQTLPEDQEALGRPRPAPVLLDQQPVVRPRAR